MKIKRRRRERKTDYLKRRNLLKSGVPRIVFRKTNRYIIGQYVISKEAQDFVKEGISSKILLNHFWPKEFENSLKSIPASYLTGLLLGKRIIEKKLKIPIIDAGMIRKISKNRFFAFLKGLKDAGIAIKCEDKFFPEENRIKGKHLKKDFSKIFEEIKSKIIAK
ncbi:50S ribosomal protein L18 [Candidatus Pacearchaeota archaeon]|nr:50S ribosomal protein L18 [Candidatus Pacearchaeota archaeon]